MAEYYLKHCLSQDLDVFTLNQRVGFDVVNAEVLKNGQEKDLGLQEFYLAEMIAQVEEIKIFPETIKPFSHRKMVDYFLHLNREVLLRLKPAASCKLEKYQGL